MAPLDTGRYIITNCRHKNVVFLPDNNDRSGVVASNREDDPGEMVKFNIMQEETTLTASYV
jgi:hypothetical protein